jgi:hypothetical protein
MKAHTADDNSRIENVRPMEGRFLKESNPVQVAEYAVANGIDAKPAFAWWLPFTIKKKVSIIAKVKTDTCYNLTDKICRRCVRNRPINL